MYCLNSDMVFASERNISSPGYHVPHIFDVEALALLLPSHGPPNQTLGRCVMGIGASCDPTIQVIIVLPLEERGEVVQERTLGRWAVQNRERIVDPECLSLLDLFCASSPAHEPSVNGASDRILNGL